VETATGSSISAKPRSNYCIKGLHVQLRNFLNRIMQLVITPKDTITISTAIVRITLMNIRTSTNLKSD